MTRVTVVLNGLPRKAARYYEHYHPVLAGKYETTVLTTASAGEAASMTLEALNHAPDYLLIAGGDGTVHEVVDGALRYTSGNPLPVPMGILPLGNGNDFARTIASRREPAWVQNLEKAARMTVDAGVIRSLDMNKNPATHYFVNIADVGASPEVVRLVATYGRMRRSPVAYYRAVLTCLARFKPIPVVAETPDWKWEGAVRSFAIGNGRRHGNGLYVTPDAQLNDGVFDCFIAGEVGVMTFLWKTYDLLKGRKIHHPRIHYRQASRVHLTADKECLLQADGELVGYLPAELRVLSKRLTFLV